MRRQLTLYGWHLSYFTGKVRCYLNHKGIAFIDQPVDIYTLLHRIKRKTGAVVMPVLRTPEGEWIQDSSVIMERMEASFPAHPITPTTPVQRFAAYLIEAWGDEWWIPMAMHTRWTYPENYTLFEREAGAHLLPHFPRFFQRKAAAHVARRLRKKLYAVGVRPEQFAMLDAWMQNMLTLLDSHFAQHNYLLGGRPTWADFGLVGSMYAHLGRDPWPARELVAPRKHLRAWINRMANPYPQNVLSTPKLIDDSLYADDGIPPTLEPIIKVIFAEFVPMLEGINQQVKTALDSMPHGMPLPRGLGELEIPFGNGNFRRTALPYTLWMAQRLLDIYRDMSSAEQQQVATWLRRNGGERLLTLDIPRLRRRGLKVSR